MKTISLAEAIVSMNDNDLNEFAIDGHVLFVLHIPEGITKEESIEAIKDKYPEYFL